MNVVAIGALLLISGGLLIASVELFTRSASATRIKCGGFHLTAKVGVGLAMALFGAILLYLLIQ